MGRTKGRTGGAVRTPRATATASAKKKKPPPTIGGVKPSPAAARTPSAASAAKAKAATKTPSSAKAKAAAKTPSSAKAKAAAKSTAPAAAGSHADEQDVLERFLLGSRVWDMIALADFEDMFPSKMRGSPRIHAVYAALADKRSSVREEIANNIVAHCRKAANVRTESTAGVQLDVSLTDAISILEQKSNELKSEIGSVQEECDTIVESIERLSKSIESGQISKLLRTNVDVNLAHEVLEAM